MSGAPETAALSWDGAMRLLEALPALPPGERGAQVEILMRNPSPGIRERVLRLGATLLPEERIAAHLRDEHDAVLRNAGLEMLKLRGARSFQLAVRLLADGDPDVVLQAVLLLDHLRDPRALEPLRAALRHDDLNVAQAAILAIGRLGDQRSIPDLLPFLDADPWLQMAAIQALGDLRSRRAVADLARMLGDPVIGPIAAEALARIGGLAAFRALAAHWIGQGGQLDDASSLGLLAHVLEGLPRSRTAVAGRPEAAPLLASLGERLGDRSPEVRAAAARCALALGPSAGDTTALAVLLDQPEGAEGLPAVLRRRPDLAGDLLRRPGTGGAWGLLLAALVPRRTVGPAAVLDALAAPGLAARNPEAFAAGLRCLGRVPPAQAPPGLGPALLGLYLELPDERRPELAPLLRRFCAAVGSALAGRAGADAAAIGAVDRVVLRALLGAPPREAAPALLELPLPERLAAIVQLAGNRPLMRSLPWAAWLREAPETYAAAAAEAAAGSRLRELLPMLHAVPPRLAGPAMARAFAELADAEAVPWLLEVLGAPDGAAPTAHPELRPLVLESLGRIGGERARRALAAAALARTAESRLAYRALASCATAEEAPLFRAAVTHPDWYVRLACAEVLGRFAGRGAAAGAGGTSSTGGASSAGSAGSAGGALGTAEDLAALSRLAADPVPAVAHRALRCLEG